MRLRTTPRTPRRRRWRRFVAGGSLLLLATVGTLLSLGTPASINVLTSGRSCDTEQAGFEFAYAADISDFGHVVGYGVKRSDYDSSLQPWQQRWRAFACDVETPAAVSIVAGLGPRLIVHATNSFGEVVGQVEDPVTARSLAAHWDPSGTLTLLPSVETPGEIFLGSSATDINDFGWSVGWVASLSTTSYQITYRCVSRIAGVSRVLSIGDGSCLALAINDAGYIVGTAEFLEVLADGSQELAWHAFYQDADGTTYDLNDAFPPDTAVLSNGKRRNYSVANDVNAAGDVVGGSGYTNRGLSARELELTLWRRSVQGWDLLRSGTIEGGTAEYTAVNDHAFAVGSDGGGQVLLTSIVEAIPDATGVFDVPESSAVLDTGGVGQGPAQAGAVTEGFLVGGTVSEEKPTPTVWAPDASQAISSVEALEKLVDAWLVVNDGNLSDEERRTLTRLTDDLATLGALLLEQADDDAIQQAVRMQRTLSREGSNLAPQLEALLTTELDQVLDYLLASPLDAVYEALNAAARFLGGSVDGGTANLFTFSRELGLDLPASTQYQLQQGIQSVGKALDQNNLTGAQSRLQDLQHTIATSEGDPGTLAELSGLIAVVEDELAAALGV